MSLNTSNALNCRNPVHTRWEKHIFSAMKILSLCQICLSLILEKYPHFRKTILLRTVVMTPDFYFSILYYYIKYYKNMRPNDWWSSLSKVAYWNYSWRQITVVFVYYFKRWFCETIYSHLIDYYYNQGAASSEVFTDVGKLCLFYAGSISAISPPNWCSRISNQ